MKTQVYRASATQDVHIKAVQDFYEGISQHEDNVHLLKAAEVNPEADCHVIFGSWKDRKRPWHQLKMQVLETKQPFVVMETPIIGRQIRNDHPYYRIGVNHYVRHLGYFNNHNCSPDRWNKMCEDLGVEIKPWRQDGKYILLCLQIPGDASLLGTDITNWALQTIKEIREITNRHIRIRPHPIRREYGEDEIAKIKKQDNVHWVEFENQRSLDEDLSEAWVTVTYTSGVGVDSIIQGVPVVGCHPGNFAYPISSPLSEIEKPSLPDRNQWLADIAYVQWSLDEIREGKPWLHLKPELERQLSNYK